MQKNICPECKTENEPEYRYCKNCGTPMPAPQAEPSGSVPLNSQNPVSGNSAQDVNSDPKQNLNETIDGNPIWQVFTFVGKNAPKIVPKFIKLEGSRSKIEWCWPPFILGFFLGPIGVAIWLLYRKMYKPACLFGGIHIALSYLSALMTGVFNIRTDTSEQFEGFFQNYFNTNVFDVRGFWQLLSDKNTLISYFYNSFTSSIGLACAILAGLFAIYYYKKHTAKAIKNYKPFSNDLNYFKIGLAAKGGTSVGAAILGTIIISLVANVPGFVKTILQVMEAVL